MRNKFDNDGNALLFSGGIDSLTSFLRNRDKHPALIGIWGAEGPSPEYNSDKQFKLWKNNFLSCNLDGSEMYFVGTNIGNLVNNDLLEQNYVRNYIKNGRWFEFVSHGLIYTGLCAPITAVKKISNLFMASSSTRDNTQVNGSHVFNFADMNWADTKVIYDSSDLSRQEKIRTQLSGNTKYYHLIKVCHSYKSKRYNCSTCEKCLRTIVGLIMENIDPNKCNFSVHNGILDLIKVYTENGWIEFGYDKIDDWKDMQAHILDHKINNLYNAIAFFEWFKDFNFSDYKSQDSH